MNGEKPLQFLQNKYGGRSAWSALLQNIKVPRAARHFYIEKKKDMGGFKIWTRDHIYEDCMKMRKSV